MRTAITIGICIALTLALSAIVSAQSVGCCCDPVTKNGSFMPQSSCPATYIFGIPTNSSQTCSQFCQAQGYQQSQPVCGNNICETGETTANCAQDCAVISGCGSPNYAPAPTLSIAPVRAQKSLLLTYTTACVPDFITIHRCKGSACTPTQIITQEQPTGQFTDNDPQLEFNSDYTYAISAYYQLAGSSTNTTATGNIGDIECYQQSSQSFCISASYYEKYRTYLITFGYAGISASGFNTQFTGTVNSVFSGKLNKAYQCNAQNKLTSAGVACTSGEYCVADEQGPKCVSPTTCDTGDPFGLYSSSTTCETNSYCFFDKSLGPTNKCYSCKQQMACADYKTQGACQRDNCNAGDCQWNSVFTDLGIGVCIDKQTTNCIFCAKNGTLGVETSQTTGLWDACTEQKSEALSTQENPCFFDKNLKVAKTCEQVTCADYTEIQCGSPTGGVQLGPDNTITTTSSDQCGIGVCQYSPTAGCVKNSDGTTGDPFKDCAFNDYACEQDYFPPQTTIIPTGTAGKIEKLIIKLFDQQTTSGASQDFAGQTNFTTHLCIANSTTNCDNAKTYPIQTSAKELILSNRQLKQGQTTLATLAEGTNTIYYYSKDNHNNVEIVKSVTFFACAACNGPQILNLSITDGAALNTTIYTSSFSPTITVTFDVPTEITFLQLQGPGNPAFNQQTSGMQLSHTFAAPTLTLGVYTFGFNGRNDKNIYFNPPGPTYTLIVDNVAPTVTIQPANTILNTSQIDVNLTFSKPVQLDQVNLIAQRYTDFAIQETPRNIVPLLTSTDKTNYKARVGNISGGTNVIEVNVRGYNNLPLTARSQFYIATRAPDMRMTIPPFGSANASQFNIEIETELPAECAYIYNTPTAPNATDFDLFQKFSDAGKKHTASGFIIPSGVQSATLHAYCRTPQWGIAQKSFLITLDTEPPIIKRVIAEPPIIAEKYYPDKDLYVTTMKVELDKPGFCKYSTTTSQFGQMNSTFPGYDLVPKTTHSVQINVTEQRTHHYYISCKGTNQLVSEPAEFDVVVDLGLNLSITSITPRGFSSTNVTIGVASNKRTFCYFGTQEDDQSTCMGSCSADYVQWQPIQVSGEGEHTYFVSCVQPSTQEKVGPIQIPVLVDTTPPSMEYVMDDGPFEDPELSWSKNKLRAAFKGNDLESAVDHYLVTIQDRNNRQLIANNLVSNVTDGNYTYIRTRNDGGPLNLVNGRTYLFKVKAVNKVGLISDEMESDGVTIDVSLEPPACLNGDRDGNETDEDCGGNECSACAIDKACVADSDCETNNCLNNVCALAICTDEVRNGFETDVDCGGSACSVCEIGNSCIIHSDCSTGYCGFDSKTCEDASHCSNGQLDVGEAGVDCGKACPNQCGEKSTCGADEDCITGLKCDIEFNICTSKPIGDEDLDGIRDPFDQCIATPPGEIANERGCSLSQTYSLGDSINDKWRLDYFGCIDCPNAAENFDYDKDTLTNKQEYDLRTNPIVKDTDRDGWKDNVEVKEGTDPLNPKSHPPSMLLAFFKVLLAVLAIAGIGVGAYLLYKKIQHGEELELKKYERKIQTEKHIKTEEIDKLKTFAKKEEIEDKDWITLEKEIKKKPLPSKQFEAALERLKKLAKKEHSNDPIEKLRETLEEAGSKERKELLLKLKLLHEGTLTQKEIEELLRKLKITAEYYEEHKKEFIEELKHYGRKH